MASKTTLTSAFTSQLTDKDIKDFVEAFATSSTNHGQKLVSGELLRLLDSTESKCQFDRLDALHSFVWEKLNTGHWKDVHLGWRELYSAVSLAKVSSLVLKAEATQAMTSLDLAADLVKVCDLGWLMGAPIMKGACGRLAHEFGQVCRKLAFSEDDQKEPHSKRLKADEDYRISVPGRGQNINELARLTDVSLVRFLTDFKMTGRPAAFRGLTSEWPAASAWSFDYLKRVCGYRLVPVEVGQRYTDESWTQTLMTVNEFVDGYVLDSAGGKSGYLAQHQLADQVQQLMDDLDVPEFCHTGDEDEDVDVNVWFGPAGTVSPLHTDPKHNVLCQIVGKKFVRLYPESESRFLYPYEDGMLNNTSRVDLEKADEKRFPDVGLAEGFEVVLEPGDALYIPPKCWHFVKSLSPSMSVSFWFR